jgi:hypothetical protein
MMLAGQSFKFSSLSNLPRMALATLLRDFPELAAQHPREVQAAHPSRVASKDYSLHSMLGYGHDVQDGLTEGDVLLLQLGSDEMGPRFLWWDCGNITFSIPCDALENCRFDLARASIEGH